MIRVRAGFSLNDMILETIVMRHSHQGVQQYSYLRYLRYLTIKQFSSAKTFLIKIIKWPVRPGNLFTLI